MIYLIFILTIFSLFLLVRKYSCMYTWYFIVMVTSLDITIFATVLYIAKLGNYQLPTNFLLEWDYIMFLHASTFKISFYSIVRMINVGIGLFLFTTELFVHIFTLSYDGTTGKKRYLETIKLAILPAFYIWVFDPNTSYDFYIYVNSHDISMATVNNIQKVVDIFNLTWVLFYLFKPILNMYKFYMQVKLSLKKKQILSLTICMFFLNLLCFMLFIVGPLKNNSFMSANLMSFPEKYSVPWYFYDVIPLAMLIIIEIMLFIVIKYKGLDTIGVLREYRMKRSIKSLNVNLRSIFHSFKNTLFTIKVLNEQIRMGYGTEKGEEALQRVSEVTNESLQSITKMLNSFKEISLQIGEHKIVDVIEQSLKKVELAEHIVVEKNYIEQDIVAVFDFYHIGEVLTNLFINASEAIEKKGAGDGRIFIEISAEHEWAIIRITDNGVGIDKKDLHSIFKPFYTTKSRKNNWGVGLSYAYRVVKAHFGFISVDSVPNSYTTFQILLLRKGMK